VKVVASEVAARELSSARTVKRVARTMVAIPPQHSPASEKTTIKMLPGIVKESNMSF